MDWYYRLLRAQLGFPISMESGVLLSVLEESTYGPEQVLAVECAEAYFAAQLARSAVGGEA